MNKSNILAHRGVWTRRSEANSLKALRAAIESGFGIETDVRDCNGKLVIAHDPPREDDSFSVDGLFSLINSSEYSGRIALNIKSDGLQSLLRETLQCVHTDQFFYFDMSIPDTLHYERAGLRFYCRLSEYEVESDLFANASGVWVDSFSGDFDQIEASLRMLESGKRVAFVSPELHGRHHEETWSRLKDAELAVYDAFELCTDFPVAAFEYFGE